MTRTIRTYMLVEAASFGVGALVHSGAFIAGYEHEKARIAETVIAMVLVCGLALTWIRPDQTRSVGLAAQGFAIVATLIGVFTIAVGVGPRTLPDIAYHLGILCVLALGLRHAARDHWEAAHGRFGG